MLPLSYEHGSCAIALINRGTQRGQIGHWALEDVNRAMLSVLLDCGTVNSQGTGGERGIGESNLDFYVQAYSPWVDGSLKLGGNLTEVS